MKSEWTDEEFCIEYVKRLARPVRRKTELELINIVEKRQRVDHPFNKEQVEQLFDSSVAVFVYVYVTQNQDLFINL